MGTTPILEMARAYGLRPRLWLLLWVHFRCHLNILETEFEEAIKLLGKQNHRDKLIRHTGSYVIYQCHEIKIKVITDWSITTRSATNTFETGKTEANIRITFDTQGTLLSRTNHDLK